MFKSVNILKLVSKGLFLKSDYHVCIVGSGPSAFYAAQYLLKHKEDVRIDMLEKLPAPFGLVRYGVAPDHPEVKNVINTFTQVAKNPHFHYWGNVTVGRDVRLKELKKCYDAILLAHGASMDRRMNIEGEDLPGVLSATDFVAWYNGYPGLKFTPPDLDCDTVAIAGVGNVALDIARILLSPIKRLQTTDIPAPVMEHLACSRVRRVVLIGRRGPLQSAFTLKEFREITHLSASRGAELECPSELPITFTPSSIFDETLGTGRELAKLISGLPRPRKRLVEFLLKTAQRGDANVNAETADLRCEFRYLRSPVRVVPHSDIATETSGVSGLDLCVNRLEGPPSDRQKCVRDESVPLERLDCGLVVRSIGYRSIRIDPDLPFDEARGVVACSDGLGRIVATSDAGASGGSEGGGEALLYASGWAKRGAVGVIVDTLTDAQCTADAMLKDAQNRLNLVAGGDKGFESILGILQQRGVRPVTFEDWERVDSAERLAGESCGKPREKFTSVEDLLRVAFRRVANSRGSNRP